MKQELILRLKKMSNKTKIGIVSLGCPKNRVDTEVMLGILGEEGYEIVAEPQDAEIIIVNTCAFVDDAKEESINTVLEMAEYKNDKCRYLIMAGCMAERYHDEILKELPEVDAVVGTGDYHKIAEVIKEVQKGEKPVLFGHIDDEIPEGFPRMISTGGKTAYLKISDGCDNKCTYCIIPKLRGKYRSRPMEDILNEAKDLADSGVREIILIAQDTTRYGYDTHGKEMLSVLLTELAGIENLHWIRVHYMYPESITDSIIDVFSSEPKVVKYMDIPIQHINNRVLKRMGRKNTKEETEELIKKLRNKIPDLTIRTTLIAGFPGETEEEFAELLEFVKWAKFEKLGAFAYSVEDGTAAAKLPDQIDEETKVLRQEKIMVLQSEISEQIQKEKLGRIVEVICEGYDKENLMYFGRSQADTLDVDGIVYFAADDEIKIGEFVWVKILDTDNYDCTGVQIDLKEGL